MRTMNKSLLTCALIALTLPACGSGGNPATTAAPGAQTTPATEPSPAASTDPAAATSAPGGHGLSEGRYESNAMTMAEMSAGIAGKYTQAELDAFFARDGVKQSAAYAFELAVGGYDLLCSADGAPAEECDHGGYTVVDDHTMTFTTDCTITFDYALAGDQLDLTIEGDTCPAADHVIHTVVYELSPFTKVADGASAAVGTGESPSYATTTFAAPFRVDVPGWLSQVPDAEEPNLVTWVGDGNELKVRVLEPVNLYAPGGTGTSEPPDDYVAYLRSQSGFGARFDDVEELTIDGRSATLLTATTESSLDGSLGCEREGMAAEDCWGLQPDLILRIAVITGGDTTMLVWLRGNAYATAEFDAHVDSFDQMLGSIRF